MYKFKIPPTEDLINQNPYYRRFKIVIGSPLWKFYLGWAYKKCVEDFIKLNFIPDFNKKDFTCLLCGVGNEVTADEFIKFVITRNQQAKIKIIDLANEQTNAVSKLVEGKYSSFDIGIKQINALDLSSFIPKNSITWIETDGFLEFFSKKALNKLLDVWGIILKKDGFITLREPASIGKVGRLIDFFRIWIAKKWLGVTIYNHTKLDLDKTFREHGFSFTSAPTFIPTFTRYSLIKTGAE
ncbi:hypothetical protein A2774_05890 [Candidatus Roizmanbacteria bacterium RIFCSPHIGHO2_01_FULL_39_12c]|uniref:Methyltransferase domain-containing protein n=1 Tax=Candidatus Roizmanbacteria bacterium RIFCSPHIGHO2_01_FULL_39_12c TaxID=1802031 RepID=A0A1F7GAA8_9BACT|nr:MAG: hypothetical protein A2774_05890 [Candidatus Roizmanbacteria bacterium RIFCSPHIGHO2_01_FULL_39_12c]OGK46464.1 MAG: hypothetical protein A2963_01705 [Candidatus Roizmanbacteria bacterium RIFCSPLOWO2_01_FULL_40_13]